MKEIMQDYTKKEKKNKEKQKTERITKIKI